MTNPVKIEQINVSSIQTLPVVTKNISEKLVGITAKIAKSNPDDIPPILVGRVNNLLYPVNEFETVSGLLKAEVKTVEAIIVDYPAMQDLIAGHVRKNFQPHTIDPLRIREVIEYMIKSYDMDVSEACKLLWLDKRPDLLAAVRYVITDKAKAILQEMIEEISKKMYSVVTPILYVERLSKIDEESQIQAALELKAVTISTMKSEDKSIWPSAESIKYMLSRYPKKIEKMSADERIARMVEIEDLKKKKEDEAAQKKETAAQKKSKAKTAKKAKNFLKSDHDLIYVPQDGAPDLIVNTKTRRVAKAEEVDGLCLMKDDLGKTSHTLPNYVTEFLDAENTSVRIDKFATLEKLQNAVAKLKKPEQKYVLLTSDMQPRK